MYFSILSSYSKNGQQFLTIRYNYILISIIMQNKKVIMMKYCNNPLKMVFYNVKILNYHRAFATMNL